MPIDIHLGSAGHTVQPYVEAINKVLVLVDKLRKKGFTIETLDIGGGYGADYVTAQSPTAEDYAKAIVPCSKAKNSNSSSNRAQASPPMGLFC